MKCYWSVAVFPVFVRNCPPKCDCRSRIAGNLFTLGMVDFPGPFGNAPWNQSRFRTIKFLLWNHRIDKLQNSTLRWSLLFVVSGERLRSKTKNMWECLKAILLYALVKLKEKKWVNVKWKCVKRVTPRNEMVSNHCVSVVLLTNNASLEVENIKHSIAPLMKVKQTVTPLSIHTKNADKRDFRIET